MATVPGLRTMLTDAEDVNNRLIDPTEDGKPERIDDGRYDGKKREPAFAHAENSCLWELVSRFFSLYRLSHKSINLTIINY